MKNIEVYNNLRVTIGWSGYPQITEADGKVFYSKKVDFIFYPECYTMKELNEYPINPYTKEKLIMEEFEDTDIKQNKSNGNKSLVICFILALALVFLCSCGARKTERSKEVTKENTVTQSTKTDSSKVVTVSDTNTKIVDNGTEEEFLITPIDSSKEMIISGKTYFNAKLSHKTIQKNKVVENKVIVAETRQNDIKEAVKTQISKAKSVEVKKTDRKANYWWVLFVILAIIALYLTNKYKSNFFK